MPTLKALSREKYEAAIRGAWNKIDFTKSLKLVYEETLVTDRFLRDVAAKGEAHHLAELLRCGEFVELCKPMERWDLTHSQRSCLSLLKILLCAASIETVWTQL